MIAYGTETGGQNWRKQKGCACKTDDLLIRVLVTQFFHINHLPLKFL